jgi:hypothetical protein
VGDAGKAENLDVKCLAGDLYGFQVLASVTSEAELKLVSSNGLFDRIVMAVELIANGRSNKVGPIGVESLLHKEINLTQVYTS